MAKLSKQYIDKSKEIKEIKELKGNKRYSDDGCTNLWLNARASGAHSWLYRFKINGKDNSFTIGKYRDVSLAEARELARSYNKMLANGKNPKVERDRLKNDDDSLFQNVALQYFETKEIGGRDQWKTEGTYKRNLSALNNKILPKFKDHKIQELETSDIYKLLEVYTPSIQKKLKGLLSSIFDYAINKGFIGYSVVDKAKTDKAIVNGLEFVHPVEDKYNFSQLINDIDNYRGHYSIVKALQLAVYIGFRPSNIAKLKWSSVDLKEKLISISAEDMKMRKDFRQPLSKQAISILYQLNYISWCLAHSLQHTDLTNSILFEKAFQASCNISTISS